MRTSKLFFFVINLICLWRSVSVICGWVCRCVVFFFSDGLPWWLFICFGALASVQSLWRPPLMVFHWCSFPFSSYKSTAARILKLLVEFLETFVFKPLFRFSEHGVIVRPPSPIAPSPFTFSCCKTTGIICHSFWATEWNMTHRSQQCWIWKSTLVHIALVSNLLFLSAMLSVIQKKWLQFRHS